MDDFNRDVDTLVGRRQAPSLLVVVAIYVAACLALCGTTADASPPPVIDTAALDLPGLLPAPGDTWAGPPFHAYPPPLPLEEPVAPGSHGDDGVISASPSAAPASGAGMQSAWAYPLFPPGPTPQEREIVRVASHQCELTTRHPDVYLALSLLRLERDVGVPSSLHGITIAAWCGEAALQTGEIVGDGGLARGILQLHPGTVNVYRGRPYGARHRDEGLRDSPIANARVWLYGVLNTLPKARRLCGEADAWGAAELWFSQGGRKSGYSCKKRSGHWRRLERWRRAMREVRHGE